MKFQEIDLKFEPIFDSIPIEIEVIFKYSSYEGKLYSRYQKISDPNFVSFTPYVDYWEFVEAWKSDLVFGENGKPIDDIIPYYEAYSKGFLEGYFEFENEIKELNQIFGPDSFPIDKIFKEIKLEVMPFSSRGYFYKDEEPIPIMKKDLLFEDGAKVGRNYKAWFYIIKNPKPFIPLFRDFYFESYKLYELQFKERNSHIENYSSGLQSVIEEIERERNSNNDNKNQLENKINPLESIWIQNPKVSLDDFLSKGYNLGLWDKEYNLTVKRASTYGSKKSLLANIFISLKENSINDNIDHKEAGKLFCQFFKIKIDPNTENPFKIFQKGNPKQIKELKKTFKINS